jgi:hypothetical protein
LQQTPSRLTGGFSLHHAESLRGNFCYQAITLTTHSMSANAIYWDYVRGSSKIASHQEEEPPKNNPDHAERQNQAEHVTTAVGRVREAADEQRPKDDFDYEFYFLHCPQFGPAPTVNLAPHILGNEVEEVGF